MANANCDDCLNGNDPKQTKETVKNPADFICYDCEKYLCAYCIRNHRDHITFSAENKSNKIKLDQFSKEMMEKLTSEGDQIVEKFIREQTHICDVVDVGSGNSRAFLVMDICILRGSKQWAITDRDNKCIKVFNINNNEMTSLINLEHRPYGITEIPSADPSQPLIAVSFPLEEQIRTIQIGSTSVHVMASINVPGRRYDLAYCNNKLITLCMNSPNGEWHGSIHVMDISGEVINVIDLNNLPGVKLLRLGITCMCVDPQTETFYVCHFHDPSCVIGLSRYGEVLHSVFYKGYKPRRICVDPGQGVYMTDGYFPLYNLSSDLSQKQKEVGNVVMCMRGFTTIAYHADTFYLAKTDGHVYIVRHE